MGAFSAHTYAFNAHAAPNSPRSPRCTWLRAIVIRACLRLFRILGVRPLDCVRLFPFLMALLTGVSWILESEDVIKLPSAVAKVTSLTGFLVFCLKEYRADEKSTRVHPQHDIENRPLLASEPPRSVEDRLRDDLHASNTKEYIKEFRVFTNEFVKFCDENHPELAPLAVFLDALPSSPEKWFQPLSHKEMALVQRAAQGNEGMVVASYLNGNPSPTLFGLTDHLRNEFIISKSLRKQQLSNRRHEPQNHFQVAMA